MRLHTSTVAETTFVGSLLVEFLKANPHVKLDVVASDAAVDIVAEGYDAGIQLGEVIDKDMIAVSVTGELGLAIVASPKYFAKRGVPKHPRDLAQHDCLNWHAAPNAPPYRWEFTEKGRGFTVTVPARVLSTDASLNRRFAIEGLGITLAFEGHVRDAIERGQLVSVLAQFCAPFPGYYLYYPQRRQASRVLRALIEHLKEWRGGRVGRKRRS